MGIGKTGLLILIISLICTSAFATYKNVYNPYTGKYDRVQDISDNVPATANSSCEPPQIAYDSSYIYVCVSSNTWTRSALSTWAVSDLLLLSDGSSAILLSDGTSKLLIR